MRPIALSALLLLAGCRYKVLPEPDFERMIRQERFELWGENELLPDGRNVQHPPAGRVARDRVTGRPGYTEGIVDGRYLDEIPVPLTAAFVQRGRQRFETFCAPCHGILGDGRSRVAAKMLLRMPPSLIGPEARSFAPGRIFQVITEGYGLMPTYASEVPAVEDRWAVVAYLKALQLSRAADLHTLPPTLRARVEEALR